MNKILILILISMTSLFSKEYMTQINPYEKIEIRSQTSGVIEHVNTKLEASYVNKSQTLIEINSLDEKIELRKEKESLSLQKEIVRIKERNYKAKNRIKQLSSYDKNNEKLSYLESKKELVISSQNIKKLVNEINKKIFKIQNKYIHNIFVKNAQYVDIGDKLFDIYDISKLKITLYLTKKEIDALKNKTKDIYINKEKSDFKITKTSKIKDEIKISRYKVELTKKNQNLNDYFFNKVVKVEIK